MTASELRRMMEVYDESSLHIMLPGGEFVPAHFHVTEVGRVSKDFIDCGGTRRKVESCVLQVWVANDVDHRLTGGKLAKILRLASDLGVDGLPVEVEYGEDVAAQYKLGWVEETPSGPLFLLTGKQTDCLAPDKCGVGGCCQGGSC